MVNWDGFDISSFYFEVVAEYEKNIEEYSKRKYEISEYEIIYIIQDSFALYIGLINYLDERQPRYIVQFEELLCNDIFKFNFSAFTRKFSQEKREYVSYKKFHGLWAEPIRGIDELRYISMPCYKQLVDNAWYFIESKSDYVDKTLPQLNLKKRYEQWGGYAYNYIIYELSDGERTGYALYCSENPQIHKTAMEKADSVERCAAEHYASSYYRNHKDFSFGLCRFMGGIICDGTILELLIEKIEQHKKNGWKHRKVHNKLSIAEHDLKYFWVTKYIKGKNLPKHEEAVFDEVHNGLYDDIQRYEYLIPENKWKSEQLVYEITKKIYKKHTVLYQHRPFFLKSGKGQMSYDVFICGINVAIEYQGKQHFEPVEIFGGKENFESQVVRDALKSKLSKENGVSLVYINYLDDISPELIKARVEEALKQRNL